MVLPTITGVLSMRRFVCLAALVTALFFNQAIALGTPKVELLDPVLVFGESGSDPGMFSNPFDVVQGPSGNLFVADNDNNRIQVFDTQGVYLWEFGGEGTGPGEFNGPSSMVFDSNNRLIIADTANHRIQIFDSQGNYLSEFGTQGTGDGALSFPNGVTVDQSGNIFVADTGNNRVQVFDSANQHSLSFGQFCRGAPVCPDGDFKFPHDLSVDEQGRIFVVDGTGDGRVQVFQSNGEFAYSFPTNFPEGGPDSTPREIDFGPDGMLYISDIVPDQITAFHPDGQPISAFGTTGFLAGEFRRPEGFGFISNGRIAVVDTDNDRVQIFNFPVPEPNSSLLAVFALFTIFLFLRGQVHSLRV